MMSIHVTAIHTTAEAVSEESHAGYFKKVHIIGRIFSILMIFANVLPVILIWAVHGIFPDMGKVLPALFVVWGLLLPFFLTEGWMYYGILGCAGNYMQWAGNSGNMRIPVCSVAQDVMKTKPGSIESEIVGNVAIGTSIPFSALCILLGAFIGNVLIANSPPSIQSAFNYAIPCIYGALIAQFSLKGPKYAVPIVLLAYVLIMIFPKSASWQRILGMLIIIIPAMWFAYKKLGWYFVSGAGKRD
jgi:hypothetical protein